MKPVTEPSIARTCMNMWGAVQCRVFSCLVAKKQETLEAVQVCCSSACVEQQRAALSVEQQSSTTSSSSSSIYISSLQCSLSSSAVLLLCSAAALLCCSLCKDYTVDDEEQSREVCAEKQTSSGCSHCPGRVLQPGGVLRPCGSTTTHSRAACSETVTWRPAVTWSACPLPVAAAPRPAVHY